MFIRDLLDNYEKRQLQMLDLLLRRPYTASQLSQTMHVTRDTVREDLLQLRYYKNTFRSKISIEIIDGYYHIKSLGKLSQNEINYYFLQHSLGYQILLYILEHGDYQLEILSDHLNISVATLTRKIRQLNQILTEFELTIAHGQIQGTELQIRYFYYLLLWYGNDYKQNKNLYLEYSKDLIEQIGEELDFVLTQHEAIKQGIWLYVTKKRYQNKQISQQKASFEKKYPTKIIDSLEEVLKIHYKNKGITWDRNETVYYQLFFFVTIEFRENYHKFEELYQKNKQDLPNLTIANQEVLKELWQHLNIDQTEELKKMFNAGIFKINLWGYFFPGFIDVYQYDMKNTSLAVKKRVDAAMEVIEKRLRIDGDHNGKMMAKYFGALLQNIIKESGFFLAVAYNTAWDDYVTEEKIKNILASTELTVNLEVIRYKEGEIYDVILTDSNREFAGIHSEQIYVLLSLTFGSNVDQQNLNQFIRSHYEKKLEGV